MLQHLNMKTKGMDMMYSKGTAQQNMNTELSPKNIITCSKGHGKIANNNSFTDLAEITVHGRNYIRLQCLELSNNMLPALNRANKGTEC